jgi:hypothetical protein
MATEKLANDEQKPNGWTPLTHRTIGDILIVVFPVQPSLFVINLN